VITCKVSTVIQFPIFWSWSIPSKTVYSEEEEEEEKKEEK